MKKAEIGSLKAVVKQISMETLKRQLLFYFMKLPHDAVMVLSLRLEININYEFLVFSSQVYFIRFSSLWIYFWKIA